MPRDQRARGSERRGRGKKLIGRPVERFKFRLALALGRTVAELERSLGAGELAGWIAFYRLEPFGYWARERPIANLAALYANAHRDPKRQARAWSADDFMTVSDPKPAGAPSEIDRKVQEIFGPLAAAGKGKNGG